MKKRGQIDVDKMLDDEYIFNVIRILDSLKLKKADAIFSKTILMLRVTNNPIKFERIWEVRFPELEEEKKIIAMKHLEVDGHEHTCIAYNSQICIYQRTSLWCSKLYVNQCLYYTLSKDRSRYLRKMTKSNLLNDYRITPFEDDLINFLRNNPAYQKDRITKEFELLQVLDETKVLYNQLK